MIEKKELSQQSYEGLNSVQMILARSEALWDLPIGIKIN
jgi:hypothetical protein